MKSIIYFISFCLFTLEASSQSTLTGYTVDSNNQPLGYVGISISQKDSTEKYIASKITDSLGFFSLEVPSSGSYIIRATTVGFEDKVIQGNTSTKVTIQLSPSTNQLSDVTVESKKPLVERKADRLVINIDNNPLAAGKSSLEAIGLTPGVLIRDGAIVLNGMTGTKVMINGKLLNLSGDDLTSYLSALRSDEIESIQVMEHPPAEYDAEGTAGLINIILKKTASSGLSGSIYANYAQGKYPEQSEGAQLNFQKGKLGLFGSYSYTNIKGFHKLNQTRDFPNDGIYTAQNRGITRDQNQRIHTGASFDFSKNHYIVVDYTGSLHKDQEVFKASSNIIYDLQPGRNTTSKGLFPSTFKTNYNDLGLNYHLSTDTLGSAFDLLSDYTLQHGQSTNEANTSFYNDTHDFLSDTSFSNKIPSNTKIFTADAKYKKVFHNGSALGFGSKLSITSIRNKAFFSYFSDDNWQIDQAQNFLYDYKEQIIAGYANYSGHILDMDVQLGIRAENTHVTGTLTDNAGKQKNPKSYFSLFPNIYLSKALNEDGSNMLNLSYNRRLNRPGFNSLNPHVSYIDNYTSGQGNPYLLPEFNNAYEISFTLNRKYIFSASYKQNKDVINNAILPAKDDNEKLVQQPINSGATKIWMITAFAPIQVTKWWTSQNTLQLSHQRVLANSFHLAEYLGLFHSSQIFQLGKGFSLTSTGYFQNKAIFANAVIDHIFNMDLGIQKKFFNNKLTVKLSGDDVFGTSKLKGRFYFDDFRLNFDQLTQKQKLTLGLTYNFNLGKAFKAKKIESSNKDEQNRL